MDRINPKILIDRDRTTPVTDLSGSSHVNQELLEEILIPDKIEEVKLFSLKIEELHALLKSLKERQGILLQESMGPDFDWLGNNFEKLAEDIALIEAVIAIKEAKFKQTLS